MKKNKYSVGFWVIDVIKSCKTKEQLKGARRLLSLFENNLKYSPPQPLIQEIYKIYDEKYNCLNKILFDPDIHL